MRVLPAAPGASLVGQRCKSQLSRAVIQVTLFSHNGCTEARHRSAIELGVPVVPVAVTGLYDVLHKGSLLIRPGNVITVFVERPILTEGLTEDDIGALRDQVREVITARVDAYFDAGSRNRSA